MIWVPTGGEHLSPLIKIPLLFVSVSLTSQVYTPPQPVPDKEDTIAYGPKPDALSRSNVTRRLAVMAQVAYWTYALCEAAVVVAKEHPGPVSSEILAWLAPHPLPAIRLTPTWLLGSALMCVGPLIRFASQRELGRFFTWELSVKKDQNLVTSGPYAIVRHPSYTGWIMLAMGTLLCHIGEGSWYRESGWLDTFGGKVLAAFWLGYIVWVPINMILRVNREDEILRNQFTGEWEAWARKTPYKLVPYIY